MCVVALTLLCEIRRRMAAAESVVEKDGQRKSLADEYSRNSLISKLAPIKVIYAGDGCRLSEVTKRQHEIVDRLGCPYFYDFAQSFSRPQAELNSQDYMEYWKNSESTEREDLIKSHPYKNLFCFMVGESQEVHLFVFQ